MKDELVHLADLIRTRNAAAKSIATFVNRPATIGELGEFIASRVFDIQPDPTGAAKGISGHFTAGKVRGKNVSVKWYGRHEGLLAIKEDPLPDFYLVMTGPKGGAEDPGRLVLAWSIDYVFLIGAQALTQELLKRGVRITETTSVREEDWDKCEMYPESRCPYLTLTDKQRAMLKLFSSKSIGI